MTIRETTFCFVCTHLTSWEKDGDEARRNFDVTEILKRTRFPLTNKFSRPFTFSPDTILEHEWAPVNSHFTSVSIVLYRSLFINLPFCSRIIWLGDLNYRLAATCSETHRLLQKNDWQSLLEKDQVSKVPNNFFNNSAWFCYHWGTRVTC